MESKTGHYLKKLQKIVPYWLKHNSEHIDEHTKWMEEARKLGLEQIAVELKKQKDYYVKEIDLEENYIILEKRN